MGRPVLVLFVCSGNVIRSPMAESAFAEAAERLAPEADLISTSAGLAAIEGAELGAAAQEALARAGLPPVTHQARQLTSEAIEGARVILTMTRWQKRVVATEFPVSRDKLFTLPEYACRSLANVPDPMDSSTWSYDECLTVLRDYCEAAVRELLTSREATSLKALFVE